MKAQFLDWWRGRSPRERTLLLVMFALAVATILWLGVYRPIGDTLSNARARHEAAIVRLGDVRTQAEALKALGKRRLPLPSGPLAPLITQSASEAGFVNAAIGAQGDRRVTVSVPAARPAALFSWIAGLEARGIVVERLSARANSDQTISVDATMTAGN